MRGLFIEYLWTAPSYYFSWVLLVTFSICVHEFCHAWVARSQGDATAAMSGFLSFDPRRVMGSSSLIALAIFGIAWGAVPVDPRQFRRRWSAALVSFSGPAANIVLAMFFACLYPLASIMFGRHLSPVGQEAMWLYLEVGVRANALLAAFNMLPIPMLDGWEVFALFVPALRGLTTQQKNSYSLIAILLLWFTPLSALLFGLSDQLAWFARLPALAISFLAQAIAA
jgi:Zn-dependent protease